MFVANAIMLASVLFAAEKPTKLTWIAGSTVRIEQLIGDCDYPAQARTGSCVPTANLTNTRAKVLGTDLGATFESQGKLYFLFGDTIGSNTEYFASDTIATSTSVDPESPLALDFLTRPDGTPFFIRIPDRKSVV